MKWIATIADLSFLTWFLFMMLGQGRSLNDDQIIAIVFVLAMVALNLAALWRPSVIPPESWLGLYLRRKKAEENAKIQALR